MIQVREALCLGATYLTPSWRHDQPPKLHTNCTPKKNWPDTHFYLLALVPLILQGVVLGKGLEPLSLSAQDP
jgi:hypothetical protein